MLAEPVRLRLLALAAEEELSIGELAELLGESQPNVSRHAAALRQAGLLADRREGTRTLVRVAARRRARPGRGRRARRAGARSARPTAAWRAWPRCCRRARPPRTSSSRAPGEARVDALPAEMGAYLAALAPLLPRRELALDAGTGDGGCSRSWRPVYERVVAVDRVRGAARARPRAHRRARLRQRDAACRASSTRKCAAQGRRAPGGADAVFASRVLHHAPQPARSSRSSAALVRARRRARRPRLRRHDDESMREQADAWLGFEPARAAALRARRGPRRRARHEDPRARSAATDRTGTCPGRCSSRRRSNGHATVTATRTTKGQ